MAAGGEGAQVQALLLRRFRGSDTGTMGRSGSVRTATGLRAAAESRAAEREKAQEQRRREEQARKAAARAAAHARRLDELAAEGEAPWKQVDEMIATKKTSEYDRAVALLRDLRALAKRQGEEARSPSASWICAPSTRAGLACRIASTKQGCPGYSALLDNTRGGRTA
jgi:hypothetical protein